jgi:hypothetical protein
VTLDPTPAEHPTLARLRAAVMIRNNDSYLDDWPAVYGVKAEDNVTYGELRAWARGEGGKA